MSKEVTDTFCAMESTCRVCLRKTEGTQSIFSVQSEETAEEEIEFRQMLKIHGGVEVLKDDGLPHGICPDCIVRLKQAHSLWKQCQQSDRKLRKLHRKSLNFVTCQKEECYQIELASHDSKGKEDLTDGEKSANDKLSEQIRNNTKESGKRFVQTSEEVEADVISSPPNTGEVQNDEYIGENAVEECNICRKTFKKTRLLIKHLNYHKRKNPNEVYSILTKIRSRKKENHEIQNNSLPSDSIESTLKNINNWIDEELAESKSKSFTCATCNQSYALKKSLIRHQKTFHTNEKSINNIPKNNKVEHKCEYCGKNFPSESKLERHRKTHNVKKEDNVNFKRYLCHICSKTFRQKTGLTFHMRTHTGDKPYTCKYCNRGFASSSNCINHERTHTGDRPFVCHYCSAAFAKSCTLKSHITTHTGEANYHCKTCGKSFRRLKYLKEHRFTHTGEKPYVCKICGVGYSHSGSLFVHQKKCRAQLSSYEAAQVFGLVNYQPENGINGTISSVCEKNMEEVFGS